MLIATTGTPHIVRPAVIDLRSVGAMLVIMGLDLFAVFANGAYFIGPMTLCVVGSWAMLLVLIFGGRDDNHAIFTGFAALPLALAGALWLWTALSLTWSISTDQTLIEVNRTGGYVAVLGVGILAGRNRAAREWAVVAFIVATTAAAVYGIGPKALPSVVDNLEGAARVAVPIGYANAMGLFVALAVPLALHVMASRETSAVVRIMAAPAAMLLLICAFFTASRGAIFALIIGMAVYFAVSPVRLKSFGALTLALAPAALIASWASGQDAMMNNRVDLALKLDPASQLRMYLVACGLVAAAAMAAAIFMGKRIHISDIYARAAGIAALASVAVAMLVGMIAFAGSQPSMSEWARQTRQDFTSGAPSQAAGAGRLVEMGSSGRWKIWEVALASWEDHPVKGAGAQSFPVLHQLNRTDSLIFVKQAHGIGFSLLPELGLVGFIIGMAFIGVSLTFALLRFCRLNTQRDRSLAAGMLALIVIYLIHSSYDWDWNMFALTLPYFFFTGVLLGWPVSVDGRQRHPDTAAGIGRRSAA